MSTHQIHGLNVEVKVMQGDLTEQARARCIGKVVNLCREMAAGDFVSAMDELRADRFGGPKHAAMLAQLDDALSAGYTKRYVDDFAPIASLGLVRG